MLEFVAFAFIMLVAQFAAITMVIAASYILFCKKKTKEQPKEEHKSKEKES